MSKLYQIKNYCKLIGIKYIPYRLIDKILHKNLVQKELYNLFSKASESEYKKYLVLLAQARCGKNFDLEKPKTFNEKIQWLKLYDTNQLKTDLTDKYEVRKWVAATIGEEYLVPLLGVWDSFDDIDFDYLPDKFVLKANHGSGWNIIVKDKNHFDFGKAKNRFDQWMKTNFAYCLGLELQYKNIKPKIIAEEYLEQLDNNLYDYKIHCFSGEPKIIQIIGNRNIENHTAKEIFLDLDWKKQDLMYHTFEIYETPPKKPENFNELIDIAKKLSFGFPYVRVDLYDIDNTVYFGEMTFTPMSGFGKWTNTQIEEQVGSWISVPNNCSVSE